MASRSAREVAYETIRSRIITMDLKPGDRMLDIGCGWGALVIAAAKRGIKALGVSLSHEQIEYGQFSCTWDNVVCGLCHVDVVIRVDNGIITLGAAQDFDGAVCDDFVCVHIGTRSGTALDAVNDELVF